jgi:hypothetical protein
VLPEIVWTTICHCCIAARKITQEDCGAILAVAGDRLCTCSSLGGFQNRMPADALHEVAGCSCVTVEIFSQSDPTAPCWRMGLKSWSARCRSFTAVHISGACFALSRGVSPRPRKHMLTLMALMAGAMRFRGIRLLS